MRDSILVQQEEKEAAVWEFYNELIGQTVAKIATLNLAAFYDCAQNLGSLDAPISEDEVWDIIKKLQPDKAPGLDDFAGRFYKDCWEIIKADVMADIGALHAGDSRMLHRLNSAYIVLILKKEDAIQVGDYRPISLVHSFAKLVTKILANWLAPKLNSMVANNQSAFVTGRCIHDNFILVQQMAKYLHARKIPTVLLKLDITKAFDTISWPLLEIMRHLGFGARWRNLLSNLLLSSSTQILLNGQAGCSIRHR